MPFNDARVRATAADVGNRLFPEEHAQKPDERDERRV